MSDLIATLGDEMVEKLSAEAGAPIMIAIWATNTETGRVMATTNIADTNDMRDFVLFIASQHISRDPNRFEIVEAKDIN